MGYLVAGFLLGLAAGWLWFQRLSPGRGFSQALRREIELGGYGEQLHQAGERLERLEERCRRLERDLAGGAGGKDRRGAGPPGGGGSGRKLDRALSLWEEGRELNEIVRRTGLSKGEIELILSLRERDRAIS